jgi:hypothetical protein
VIARRFAKRHIEDLEILEVIELHDEAYNAWIKGQRGGKWEAARARADLLIDRLNPSLGFYTRFYQADSSGSQPPKALTVAHPDVEKLVNLQEDRSTSSSVILSK